jgi:hypothetical protein
VVEEAPEAPTTTVADTELADEEDEEEVEDVVGVGVDDDDGMVGDLAAAVADLGLDLKGLDADDTLDEENA